MRWKRAYFGISPVINVGVVLSRSGGAGGREGKIIELVGLPHASSHSEPRSREGKIIELVEWAGKLGRLKKDRVTVGYMGDRYDDGFESEKA